MSRRSWVIWSCALGILLLIFIHAEYRNWQKPIWAAETSAEALAMQTAGLVTTESAEKYVWDEQVWIVRGKDAQGREAIAWLRDDKQPLVLDSGAGVQAKAVKALFKQRQPDGHIRHVKAGMLGGEPVWEVFYTREVGQKRFYYDFYQFESGSYMTTYSLTTKTAS